MGDKMGAQAPVWIPVIFALFGTLVVVVFTAWLNSRMLVAKVESVRAELSGKIDALRAETNGRIDALRAEVSGKVDALRAEMKESMAELELRLSKQIMEVAQRVDRLEETRGLVRP